MLTFACKGIGLKSLTKLVWTFFQGFSKRGETTTTCSGVEISGVPGAGEHPTATNKLANLLANINLNYCTPIIIFVHH